MSEEPVSAAVTPDEVMPGETLRGRDLLGLPVYSIKEGKHLGKISGLLVQREDCSVPVISIQPSGMGRESFVPYTAMITVGVDIVLLERQDVLLNEVSVEVRKGLDTGVPGRAVITQSGERAGSIVGFGIDTVSGRIDFFRVEASTNFLGKLTSLVKDTTVEIPRSLVISLGPDAVIVQDSVQELLHPSATDASPESPLT